MRFLIVVLFVALALGGLLVTGTQNEPGYILVVWLGRSLEMSVPFAIVLMLLAFVILYTTVFVFFRLVPGVRRWYHQNRLQGAHAQTVRGLLEIAEGLGEKGVKRLTDAAPRSDTPLINYLMAARAANDLGQDTLRENALSRALEAAPDAQVAVALYRAELQYGRNDISGCINSLEQLHNESPRHARVLRRLIEVRMERGEWEAVAPLVERAKSTRGFNKAALALAQGRLWSVQTQQETSDLGDLAARWKKLGRKQRADSEHVIGYVATLLDFKAFDDAESEIRKSLDRQWDDRLVRLYGRIPSNNPEAQQSVAQSWVASRPMNGHVHFALAQILLRAGQTEEAARHLDKSRDLLPSAGNLAAIARLALVQQGDAERGEKLLDEALALIRT